MSALLSLKRWHASAVLFTLSVLFFAASISIVAIPYALQYRALRQTPVQLAAARGSRRHQSIDAIRDDSSTFFALLDGYEKEAHQMCELQPDSREQLGRGTWSLLHIMAATYPADPSPQVILEHMLFFELLPRVYPCPECRAHMGEMFRAFPPRLESQHDFSHWLCEAHNRVNARLGKPEFDCNNLDDHWDCGCKITPGPADENALQMDTDTNVDTDGGTHTPPVRVIFDARSEARRSKTRKSESHKLQPDQARRSKSEEKPKHTEDRHTHTHTHSNPSKAPGHRHSVNKQHSKRA